MIWLQPLGATHPYDADEPEGVQKPRYTTKRDLIIMVGALVAILLMLTPVYYQLLGQRNKVICSQNLKALYDANSLYAADYEERYPPAFFDSGSGVPTELGGYPVTWASVVQNKMSGRAQWFCPESKEEERSKSAPFQGKEPISMSYGLYVAIAGRSRESVASPSQTVMIAETITGGVLDSYNPKPMGANDGFLIGYSSGNDTDPFTVREAMHVTRLAFRGTGAGNFESTATGRHGTTIQVIFADGSLGSISADDAAVMRRTALDADLIGLWSSR